MGRRQPTERQRQPDCAAAVGQPVTVLLRIEQERGCYGGAALPEPIQLDCGPGQIALGDWSKNEGC